MTKASADGSGAGKMSEFFMERSSVKSKKLVQDWVNSSPAGNIADVANEPSLLLSGSIAQSNQALVSRPSSTHHARAATASIYASITTNKLWYANSTKRPKHSPTTVSSNNALRWFAVRSSIPSQVEHAGTVKFSQPSAFTTFKCTH